MIALYLSKQQALDVDPKAIKQINFTGNLSGNNNRLIFFITQEMKKKQFEIFHKDLLNYCNFILFWYNVNIK